jgi:hypothetical protein
LLYALWTRPQAAWSAALADDLRSCSLVLFAMGERAPWVRKCRDMFERLVSAAMEKLQASDAGGDGGVAGEAGEARAIYTHENGAGETSDAGSEPVVASGQPLTYHMDINTSRPGPPMNTPQVYDTTATAIASMAPSTTTAGAPENESWRRAEELAMWIARDNGVPDWMPDLEMLPNLWSG